jgi:Flp pilus assembly protein TadD
MRAVFAGVMAAMAVGCAGAHKPAGDPARQVRLAVTGELASRGDWAGTFEAADALCREDPNDARALFLRGAALRHKDMRAEAEADLLRALELEPGWPQVHAELAVLCDQEGRGEEAVRYHRRALELAPGNAGFMNDLAFSLFLKKKTREAVTLYQEALKVEPGSPRIRNNLGFALAELRDFQGAARQFALAGTPSQASNNLGFAYERAGNLAQAFESYAKAVRLDPGARAPRRNLEHVASQLGRELPPEAAEPAPALPADTQGGS